VLELPYLKAATDRIAKKAQYDGSAWTIADDFEKAVDREPEDSILFVQAET
jgi:hypothetical protein